MNEKVGHSRTMGDILQNKKLRMGNKGGSTSNQSSQFPMSRRPSLPLNELVPQPLASPQSHQPLLRNLHSQQPSPQQLPTQQPPLRNPRISQTRKSGGHTSEPLQQPPSLDATTHPPSHSSSPTACHENTVEESPNLKRGRGKSLGIKTWNTGIKHKVNFDKDFNPLNASFKTQLGMMVRNCYCVPLTYVDWGSVPDTCKEDIWQEVKDNLEDCPDEYKSICLDNCRLIWKDNKGKIKAEYYTPYIIPDPDPTTYPPRPDFVCPIQWKQLVDYWRDPNVAARAKSNSDNRGEHGPLHSTGRTYFAQIRHNIATKGEDFDKMTVFIQTRRADDPEVISIVTQYNRQLELLGEDERTIEARDKIFHSIVGEDNHGYCRTYGGVVSRSSVYHQDSKQAPMIDPTTMADIVQRIDSRLRQRFEAQFEELKAQMFEKMSSESSRHVPDAASGHRSVRNSVEDDNTPLEQSHRTPPVSSIPDDRVRTEVYLQNSGIPKVDVGEGLLITMDDTTEIDGKPIGKGYCKVLVTKALRPVSLARPRQGIRTIAEAIGRYIAWRACDVIEKEMDC